MVREGKWAGGGTFCLEAMAAKMLTCPSLLAFSMKRRAPARLSMASWQKGRKPGMTTGPGEPGKGEGRGVGGGGVPVATRGEPVVDAVVLVPGHAVLCDGAGRGKAVEGGGNRTTGSYLRVGGEGGVGEGATDEAGEVEVDDGAPPVKLGAAEERDAEVEPGV